MLDFFFINVHIKPKLSEQKLNNLYFVTFFAIIFD